MRLFVSLIFIVTLIGFLNLHGDEADKDLLYQDNKYHLVICAIFQNEDFYLKEWLEYHRLVGVEHFYLYNNLSSDNSLKILQPYIEQGIVDLYDWPVETHNQKEYLELLQLPAYNLALDITKKTAVWAAFIDLDEFLVPVRHDNLIEMLHEYRSFAGLAVNWQVFGTSEIDNLSENELIVENLLWKAPVHHAMNEIVKFIVQPRFVDHIPNPHSFEFYTGFYAMDTNGIPLKANQMGQPVVIDTACINHYWFGTLGRFINYKIPRRAKWGIKIPNEHLGEIISIYNQVRDDTILKFLPELRNRMSSCTLFK